MILSNVRKWEYFIKQYRAILHLSIHGNTLFSNAGEYHQTLHFPNSPESETSDKFTKKMKKCSPDDLLGILGISKLE